MFIFRKKRGSSERFKTPIYHKNRNFHYFNKRKNATNSNIISALLISVLVCYILFFSGVFDIKNIYIENNVNLKKDDLIKSVEENLAGRFAGIIPFDNYFISNEKDIRSFLLEKYPMIETLTIEKRSYNEMTVSVKEKESRVIWCRLDDCFYLDNDSIAFANEKEEIKLKNKPLKIYEQSAIEEEAEDKKTENNSEDLKRDNAISAPGSSQENESSVSGQISDPIIEKPININDKVADADFIRFLNEIDLQIANKTNLHIKYYKTKGVRTREVIAYTDKNIRLYFDSSADPASQTNYLASFLSEGIAKDKITDLKYIYLKSDNKIFYK